MVESASAFVPGHVTVFFSVHRRETPERTGSRGAGVTLQDGVSVRVAPAPTTEVCLNGAEREMPTVANVLEALGVTARVEAESSLPIGAGFGVSGAMALGTAFAANRVFETGRTENELITVAHVAEVEAGTGLGDVVAQARGGVPIRTAPGAPDHGSLDGVPASGRIEWLSFGGLSTAEVIGDDTAALSTPGESSVESLREEPTLPELFRLGRAFARDTGLVEPAVREVVEAVTRQGGEATMAMLGRTVVALEEGLSAAGYDANACRINAGGATLRSGGPVDAARDKPND